MADVIKRNRFNSLAGTLALYFMALSLIVLFFSSTLQVFFGYQSQKQLIVSQQSLSAQNAANTVRQFITDKLGMLEIAVKVNSPIKATASELDLGLNRIVGIDSSIQRVILLDTQGTELSKASRLSLVGSTPLQDQTKNEILTSVIAGTNYTSKVYIYEATSEPHMLIAAPVKDTFGDVKEAIVAEINLKFMWDLVGNITIGENGNLFVVDADGYLIAYKDISKVLKGEDLSGLKGVEGFVNSSGSNDGLSLGGSITTTGILGTKVVSTYAKLGLPNWAVVVEQPIYEAYGPVINQLRTSLIVIALGIGLAVLLGTISARRISKPIIHLRDAAIKIGAGDLTTRIPIETKNEIGELSLTFNQMTTQLQTYQEGLKQNLDKLSEEEARLAAAAQALSLGLLLVDSHNEVVIANKAIIEILNLPNSFDFAMIASKFGDTFDIAKYCQESRENRKITDIKDIKYGSGYLRILVHPVISPSGQVIGTILLVDDITEAKLLERSRDEFFSIASHELRTPLTAIRGNLSLITSLYPDILKDQGVKEIIDDIHESSVRLIAIVNDFLNMSRLELGKMHFDNRPVNIREIVDQVIQEYTTTGSIKNLYLKSTPVDGEVPQLYGDEDRIKQILINLVSNGFKFTDDGGVTIGIKQLNEDYVKIFVTDTGHGISAEGRKLLFRKFQQTSMSIYTRDAIHGTGLGLYISKLMAEGMAGKLELEETEVGKGSTFSLTLAVASDRMIKKVNDLNQEDALSVPGEFKQEPTINEGVASSTPINVIVDSPDEVESSSPETGQ